MGRISYFKENKEEIISHFTFSPFYFSNKDIIKILSNLKEKSLVSESMYFDRFLNALIEEGLISYSVKIKDQYYTRYSFSKEFNPFKFATNLVGSNSFLSMSTALNFAGLTKYREEIIFTSHELTQKVASRKSTINQILVDKAFRDTMPRYTSNTGEYEGKTFVMLSPKHSNNCEVIKTTDGLRYSSINRALVEMVINVQYFKTSETIIEIFKPIKELIDIRKVFKFIEKLDYIYPYYQSIGYYLEQIGFTKKELSDFKKKVSDIDFYTQKSKGLLGGDDYHYDNYWKLYN